MISFENNKLNNLALPMSIVRMLTTINEYKGKQDLYKKQSPQILNTLKDVAVIQSAESSNRIEGIYTSNKRLRELMDNKIEPRDISESEIAGYRDVLNTIHSAFDDVPVKSSVLLQLHRGLYKSSSAKGGNYKNIDNVIEEILPNGTKYIRFKPVDAFRTPNYMERLCEELNKSSMLWHDGKNNLYIWLEYFLGVIIKAYKELEDRVGCIENTKGSKSERIEMAIEGKLGYFTKKEIRNICPDVGEATINRVFEKLRVEGKIEAVGKGRNSKWKKL